MDEIHLARVQTKLAAAQVTSDRISSNHEEDVCFRDLKDWTDIANKCFTLEELESQFNIWVDRAVAWDIKRKGRLN